MIRKHPHQTGFTLVEMAIVLAILGIILGGLFAGTSALRETSKFKEDQQKLQDIKAALLSYVAVNHYLPCPDTSGDGIENPNDFSQAQCNATSGNLPHLSLGTHAVNAYGLPFSYYVNTSANDANSVTDPGTSASYFGRMNCNPNTTNQTSAPCFNKDTPPTSADPGIGNFAISNDSSNIAINIPLVVISHGQNGCNSVTGREADNCTSNAATYYQAPQNREGPNAFDDVLIWLSSLEIKSASPTVLAFYSGNQNENDGPGSSHVPTTELEDTDLLDGAPTYDDVDSGQTLTLNNQTAILGDVDSGGEVNLNNSIVKGEDMDNGSQMNIEGDNIIELDEIENGAKIREIDGSNGNNSIRINGDVDGKIELNNGNNKIYIEDDLDGEITLGNGVNIVYIDGDIKNNRITVTGGTLYVNGIPLSKIKIQGDAEVIDCFDPDMNCP